MDGSEDQFHHGPENIEYQPESSKTNYTYSPVVKSIFLIFLGQLDLINRGASGKEQKLSGGGCRGFN